MLFRSFHDLFELATKAARYERMLDEEQEKKNSSKGTYYRDPNYEIHSAEYEVNTEVDVAEIVSKRPYMCKSLPKPTEVQLSSVKTQPFEAEK